MNKQTTKPAKKHTKPKLTSGFSPKTNVTIIALLVIVACFSLGLVLYPQNPTQKTPIEPQHETDTTTPLVKFSAVGDFGANETTKQVLKLSVADSDFTLALGDFAYDQSVNEEAWCQFVREQVGDRYPFQLVAGNHDLEGDQGFGRGHFDRYTACLPNRIANTSGTYGSQYYFDYNNQVRIIAVSPNLDVLGHKGDYTKTGAEYAWLSQAITDAHDKNIPWVVIAMHENCITVGQKTCEIGQDILDLAVEERVDLILQAHEHGYMRSKQLTNHTSDCMNILPQAINPACANNTDQQHEYKKGEGSVLVINGTGGAPLRDINTNRPDAALFADWHGKNIDPSNGPIKVNIYSNRMTVDFINTDEVIKDSFTITRQ